MHTTGSGPWVKWHENGRQFRSPMDAALETYEERTNLGPHFLMCGETGETVQLCEVEETAQHVGSKGAWRYRFPGWEQHKDFSWFHKRFPDCKSPRDLFGGELWRKGSANELSIGIEIAPPLAGARAPWMLATWHSLHDLVEYLTQLCEIPRDRYHVITHSDAHPLARCTGKGLPWDPGPSQWMVAEASHYLGLA